MPIVFVPTRKVSSKNESFVIDYGRQVSRPFKIDETSKVRIFLNFREIFGFSILFPLVFFFFFCQYFEGKFVKLLVRVVTAVLCRNEVAFL